MAVAPSDETFFEADWKRIIPPSTHNRSQYAPQEPDRVKIDSGAAAFARSGNIQHLHRRGLDPRDQDLGRWRICQLDQAPGPAESLCDLRCQARTAAQRPAVEDQRGICIAHVPSGTLRVGRRRGFPQRVARGERPILGQPASRAPAAARQTQFQRHIERCTIHTGLSARDNFQQQKPLASMLHATALVPRRIRLEGRRGSVPEGSIAAFLLQRPRLEPAGAPLGRTKFLLGQVPSPPDTLGCRPRLAEG